MNHRSQHRMCEACWFDEHGLTVPARTMTLVIGYCCFCGEPTIAGIGRTVQREAVTRSFCQRNKEVSSV